MTKNRSRAPWLYMLVATMAVLLLGGCAAKAPTLKPGHTPTPGKGIVLGSVMRLGYAADAWVYIQRKGQTDGFRLVALGMFKQDTPIGQYDGNKGSLFTLELEPGEYEITNWALYYFIPGYNYFYYVVPESPEPIPFTVEADRISYIGSFEIGDHRDTPSGHIVNAAKRDLPLFHDKYRDLSELPIQHVVPDDAAWRGIPTKQI